MKILVVDDSSTIRIIAKKELAKGGYEVLEAEDGEEALQMLISTPIDLITLDIEMPRLNGYETFRKLNSDEFSQQLGAIGVPPVILLTSHDTLEERRKGFDLGAANYITKPFLEGELLASVDQILKPENRFEGLVALVVDDSKAVRIFVSGALQKEGINVIEASDGQEAFEIFQSKISQIDLVITDMVMPRMTGKELCKKIRVDLNHKGVPIIFLSGLAQETDILELFKEGATDYLHKPFLQEELLARINVHLNIRLLNRRLTRSVQKLKKLGKMKDDFLAICSHDLRGPLGAIRGFADLIEGGNISQDNNQEFARLIKSSSDFLLTLVNDLLDLGKMQSENEELEMLPLDISDILETCKKSMEHTFSLKNLSFDFITDNENEKMIISGNSSALTRITNNLLSNAVKFTPRGGKVQLVLSPYKEKQVSLSVIDNGVGIPKEKIPQLFHKFSKASKLGTEGEKSTGLGLSIVKELVENHGGSIEVTSEKDKGTTFRVLFPLMEVESPEPVAKIVGRDVSLSSL